MKKETYFVNSPDEIKRLNMKFDNEQAKAQLLDMGFKKGMRFLDVGCGTGRMCQMVSKYDRTNRHVNGVDMNEKHVAHARAEAENAGGRIQYSLGNVYKLPFPDNSFDFIWSRFFFEYLAEPQRALKEIRRVTKKGGIIAIGDIDGNCIYHYPLSEKFEAAMNEIMKTLAKVGFDPLVGRKLFHYMNQAKLTDVKVKLYPYHNIYGVPNPIDLFNWTTKINATIAFVEKQGLFSPAQADKIRKEFLAYIRDKRTFTYSTLIFARGKK